MANEGYKPSLQALSKEEAKKFPSLFRRLWKMTDKEIEEEHERREGN